MKCRAQLILGQFVGVRSNVFRITESTSPLGRIEWFAPIIGDPHHFSLAHLSDACVPINPTIAVVAVPFDHHHVAAGMSPRDAKLETSKVRFHLGNSRFAMKHFSTLRPSSDRVAGKGRPKQALNPRFMTRLFHRRDQ